MSLNYDKFKENQDSGSNQWASYSDLFMALSFIFLLLYVTSSLRSGTNKVQQNIENQKIMAEAEDLRQQIKVYNTLKQEHLEKEASKDEKQVYSELMDKLKLLREDAKDEKNQLRQQAAENEKKEFALNKYQQVIRNIINANMLAKTRIKRRDTVIKEKDEEIEASQEVIQAKQVEIKDLETTIQAKKQEIKKTKKKIVRFNQKLKNRMAQLKKQRKQQKISKSKYQKQLAAVKAKNRKDVKWLKNQSKKKQEELQKVSQNLNAASQQLQSAEQQLIQEAEKMARTQAQLSKTQIEAQRKLQATQSAAAQKLQATQSAAAQKLQATRSAAAQKLQATQQAAARKVAQTQTEAQRRVAAAQQQAYAEKLAKRRLASELSKTKMTSAQKVAAIKREKQKVLGELQRSAAGKAAAEARAQSASQMAASASQRAVSASQRAASLSKDLKAAKARADAKKNLTKRIMENFRKAGIKANVDGQTGDITLAFGKEYFDTGRADLKPNMKKMLEKFVPIYSKSLFQDKKVAKKLNSVEIVGFASPTFKGKYIDPKSLDLKDRTAVNYNLDLSYRRARSIFNYMFDANQLEYQHQRQLLPLVKVTGRSFLSDSKAGRSLAKEGMTQKEFCKAYDCKKAQKVIIRFNLD